MGDEEKAYFCRKCFRPVYDVREELRASASGFGSNGPLNHDLELKGTCDTHGRVKAVHD